MLQVRKFNMTTRLIKIIAAATCATSALGISLTAKPSPTEALKKVPAVASNSKALVISNPEAADDYGIGTYRIEGILGKNTKIKVQLDDQPAKDLVTNSADGQYDLDVEVKESGKHVLLLTYKDSKGTETAQKLEFRASNKKLDDKGSNEPESNNEEPIVATNETKTTNPEANNAPEPKHEVKSPSTLVPDETESSDDPNSAANRKASGVHDTNIKTKAEPTKPKPAATAVKKAAFVLSSHTNFNVVPHGIIKIGGKGNPGDKIMLLVDNKPSMRGTVKPDGKWTFPVKIAKPGFRKITAQDLKSREAKTIKLKIK
jgi:hypothetical protein